MRISRLVLFVGVALAAGLIHAAYAAPPPDDLLLAGDRLRASGDYPAALAMYQQALDAANGDPDGAAAPVAHSALYRAAQTHALDGNAAQAVATWQKFLQAYPDDARKPLAQLQLANALRAAKNLPAAYLAYQAYRVAAPSDDLLAPYVALVLGQGYFDSSQYALAITEFNNALKTPDLLPATRALTAQRLGDALSRTGNYTDAVSAYDSALQLAQTQTARSQLDVAAARALKEIGRTDEAVARLKRVLSDAPQGDAAPQAVDLLLTLSPKDLNFFEAGLAYYYRRQYDTAIKWFHRHLDEQADLDLAHYYAARSYELSNQQEHAIREWTTFIATHPTSSKLLEGMFERADDYHRLAQDATAIRLYQQLAAGYPASPFAENSLYAIGRIYEDAGKFAEAAKQYEAQQTRFPNGVRAAEALAAAGFMRYRANDLPGARVPLEKLSAYPDSTWKAKGLFWLGKVLQKQGLAADAQARWMQAYQAKPDDYYAIRGYDLAQGTTPTGVERKAYTVPATFGGAQLVMERWLKQWADLTLDAPMSQRRRLSTLRDDLANDRRLLRGKLLLEVGMRNEGRAELRALAEQVKDDALAQYQLGLLFRDLGQHDLVIRAGYRILAASHADDPTQAPEFLQRMIYPAPFDPLVTQAAQTNGFDPLLLYGLIWQESQFDPYATSSAGARGLGQVMPGTGDDIARWLRRNKFKTEDLYKPYVSIEFGATYYARTLDYVERDFMLALAGYNGGPGNAVKWKQADVDMAVESITLSESRTYVKRVYQHYWFYRKLYAPSPVITP